MDGNWNCTTGLLYVCSEWKRLRVIHVCPHYCTCVHTVFSSNNCHTKTMVKWGKCSPQLNIIIFVGVARPCVHTAYIQDTEKACTGESQQLEARVWLSA